jgi:hypothetical protein
MTRHWLMHLKRQLAPFGLAERVALCVDPGGETPPVVAGECLGLDVATDADLLLNLRYGLDSRIVRRFRRSALLDIDPGLFQIWVQRGFFRPARHDLYFTIGETVGREDARFPSLGLPWIYTPPCVALDWWPVTTVPPGAAFTTVTHWYAEEWMEDGGEVYSNDKRSGFLPFLQLPQRVAHPMELATQLGGDVGERETLEALGWRLQEATEVAGTPQSYQRYIQSSLAEFSCAKPSCIRLQNAWISDRTLCYLASGRPAVIQHTGPSQILPDEGGLFRFQSNEDAIAAIDRITSDFDTQSRRAREIAEGIFDGRRIGRALLEKAL